MRIYVGYVDDLKYFQNKSINIIQSNVVAVHAVMLVILVDFVALQAMIMIISL